MSNDPPAAPAAPSSAADNDVSAAAAAAAQQKQKQKELEDFAKTFDATPGDIMTSSCRIVSEGEGRRPRSRSKNQKEGTTGRTRARSSNPRTGTSSRSSSRERRDRRSGSRVGRRNRTTKNRRPSSTGPPQLKTTEPAQLGLRSVQTTTPSIRDHFAKKATATMPRRDSDDMSHDMSLLSAFDSDILHAHLADAKSKQQRGRAPAGTTTTANSTAANIFARRAQQDLREVDQSVNLMNAEAGQYSYRVSESDVAGGGNTPPRRTASHRNNNNPATGTSFFSKMFGTPANQSHNDVIHSRGSEHIPMHHNHSHNNAAHNKILNTTNMKYPRTSMKEINLGPDPTHHRHTAFYLQQRAAERDNPWNNFKRFCTKVTKPVKQLVCSPPFLTMIVLIVTLIFWIPYLQESINHRVVVVGNSNATGTEAPTAAPNPSTFLDMAGDLLYSNFGRPRPFLVGDEGVDETVSDVGQLDEPSVGDETSMKDKDTLEDGDGDIVHSGAGEATKPPTVTATTTTTTVLEDLDEATRIHKASGEISSKPKDEMTRIHTASGEISKQKDSTTDEEDARASGTVSQQDRDKQEGEVGDKAGTAGEVSQADRDKTDIEEDEETSSFEEEDLELSYHGQIGERLELFKNVIVNQDLTSTDDLTDHGSDQFQALMWLAMSSLDTTGEDESGEENNRRQLDITSLRPSQVTERYVAAVFYFATQSKGNETLLTRPPRNHTGPDVPEKNSFTIVEPSDEGNNSGRLLQNTSDQETDRLENWLTAHDLCDWEGISCFSNGHVRALSLPKQSLQGTIPSELQGFRRLERLDLNDNFIGGTLPSELATLGNLVRLDLQQNLFEGGIPAEYGLLDALEIFHLQYNLLDGHLPSEIGELAELRVFNIKQNMFSGNVPTEISQLRNLEKVYFDCNALEGPVPVLDASLASLKAVQLASNQMTGVISENLCTIVERLQVLACDCLEMVECSCCHHCS